MDTILEKAQDFIWRNARLLERQLFTYLNKNGSKEAVLNALKAYQNPDGGFGNGLEPDKRTPHSQPVDVEIAFEILDLLDDFSNPMVIQACDYLQTITTDQGGVPFALPTVMNFPRAPWWQSEENPPASLNPTCSLAGYLLKHNISHPWVDKAVDFCWKSIKTSETTQFHEIMPMLHFLEHIDDERTAHEIEQIKVRIKKSDVVKYEKETEGYVQFPPDWAPSPSSSLHSLFDAETIQQQLQILKDRQQPDGGWPINWVPVSTNVELEWRGLKTIFALLTLRAYEIPLS